MLAMDPARLAPASGTRLAAAGECGGIGTRLIEAALTAGLQVADLDLPVSMQKRLALTGEWQIACDAPIATQITHGFAAIA